MSHIDYYNGYYNMHEYPYAYPVSPPNLDPVLYRQDNYKPPVGLNIDWTNFRAQLSLDDQTTRWLAAAIDSGANAGTIATGLAAMGVITAELAPIVAVISGILKVGGGVITSTNTIGGNKGVYFDIPWYVLFPVGILPAIPAIAPKPRY
ncbi:hypothetical protein MU858_28460 (plasmid) [Bacillus sp. PGP15]|uniref:hypothetical protein n=1 Tax=Bacillus TaxID=1386 RepID=UPI0020010C0C|nr:hypothetical protein [Bacillus sp. PGP15]UPL47389.1 hypothetical protein MU858_28460 [Bacillus sp. PGP15]